MKDSGGLKDLLETLKHQLSQAQRALKSVCVYIYAIILLAGLALVGRVIRRPSVIGRVSRP